jgi:hypothetical protein
MSVQEQIDFDPDLFVERMKAAGFKFISDKCPIKLAGRHKTINQPDGTVLWQQWMVLN